MHKDNNDVSRVPSRQNARVNRCAGIERANPRLSLAPKPGSRMLSRMLRLVHHYTHNLISARWSSPSVGFWRHHR